MHSRQGQLVGLHFFISFLNILNDAADLYSSGTIFHSTGPKYLNESVPLYTEFTHGFEKVEFDLKDGPFLSLKISLTISGVILFLILNISIATKCIFL